jgi:hypothetical protein
VFDHKELSFEVIEFPNWPLEHKHSKRFWRTISIIVYFSMNANINSGFLIYTVLIVQAYETSQYVVPCSGIFLGKWLCSFAGSFDGKLNVQSACALNTQYLQI